MNVKNCIRLSDFQQKQIFCENSTVGDQRCFFRGEDPALKKKGVVRNLLRVQRIVANSEPFLGFVPIRFRTKPFFTIEKKGFVDEVSYKTIFLQSRKGCRKHGFVKYDPTLCSDVSLNSVP